MSLRPIQSLMPCLDSDLKKTLSERKAEVAEGVPVEVTEEVTDQGVDNQEQEEPRDKEEKDSKVWR